MNTSRKTESIGSFLSSGRVARGRVEMVEALKKPRMSISYRREHVASIRRLDRLRQLASRSVRWEIEDMNIADSALARIAALLFVTALFVGCGSGSAEEDLPGLRDDVYIQVMTELMLLDSSPPAGSTPAERESRADSMRSEILESYGVTAHEVLDFVQQVGGEASRMEDLWHRITQKYDSTRIADLRRDTEARSEAEGKLGEEARAGAAGSTTPGTPDASAADGKPNAADARDSAGAPSGFPRGRRNAIQRPSKTLPATRDTTVPPR
jgi:hypothetical protein